jgi:hypothetical protein
MRWCCFCFWGKRKRKKTRRERVCKRRREMREERREEEKKSISCALASPTQPTLSSPAYSNLHTFALALNRHTLIRLIRNQ